MLFLKADAGNAAEIAAAVAALDLLLSRMEARVRGAFAQFMADAQDPALVEEVTGRVAAGDIEGALNLIDSPAQRFGALFPDLFTRAAQAEVVALTPALSSINPTVAISFNATDPAAASIMRANNLEFVQQFTDQQRAVTRDALTDAIGRGGGREATARAFRGSIGLTQHQEQAVKNYEAALRRAQSGASDALSRTLRDARFDPTVARAAETGEPLTPDQVERMVTRYRERMKAGRAATIARTESVKTMSQAREEAFRQTLQQAGIDPAMATQTWRAVADARTRDTHRAMSGQEQPLGQAFLSPSGASLRYPGDPLAPASEVINCRCHRVFRINIAAMRAPLTAAA